jgi:ABC-2 type transport system permease protein
MIGVRETLRKGWVVTLLTVRYLLSTRRGLATLALAWTPLLLVAALALARVASFDILLYQGLMVPVFLQIVLIFVTLVDATAIIREEIDDNTLPYLLTRPISKPALAMAKYAGFLVAACALLLPPVLVSYGITEAYAGIGLAADADVLTGFLAATALGVMAYGALFFFLSVVLRKPLFVGLLVGFVWENIVGSLPGSVPKLSLIYYLRSVLKGLVHVGPLTGFPTDVSAPLAATILVAIALVLVVLAVFLFQAMEFRQKA